MKKNRFIPFSLLPGSWGLKGNSFKEAEANYYYEGKDLDDRLAEIKHANDPAALSKAKLDNRYKYGEITHYDYDIERIKFKANPIEDELGFAREKLGIDAKHQRITPYEYDVGMLMLENRILSADEENYDPVEFEKKRLLVDVKHRKLTEYDFDIKMANIEFLPETPEHVVRVAEIEFKHGKIDKHNRDKIVATAKEEPWVAIIDDGFDAEKGLNGVFISLDWNDYWIMYLRQNGFSGPTDNHVIDQWFAAVCRTQYQGSLEADDMIIPFDGGVVKR